MLTLLVVRTIHSHGRPVQHATRSHPVSARVRRRFSCLLANPDVPRLGERYVQAGPGTIQQMEANLDAVAVSNAWEVAAAASEPGRPAQLVPTIG